MRPLRWMVGALAVLACVPLAVSPSRAQTAPTSLCGVARVMMPTALISGSSPAYASQSVSNLTASAAPTRPIPSFAGNVIGATVFVEQTSIRFRVDGATVAHTTDGEPMAAGSLYEVCGSDLDRWSAIASSTGSNAILRWRFYTQGG